MSFKCWSYISKLINSIFFQQPRFPLHYILYIRGGWPGPHGRTSKSSEHFQNAQYCAWSPYMKYTLTHFPVEYFEANLTRSFDIKVRTASTFYVLFNAWMGGLVVWNCEGHSTLWEVEGDGMRGVKVSYWQNGQNGQNRPSLPSSHPWPVSPQSTLGWIFPEKPLLESFTWKAVLEESFGLPRNSAIGPP